MKKIACIIYACCALCISIKVAAQIGVGLADDKVLYSTEDNQTPTDTSHLFTVKEISIEGNRYTRDATILRELAFHEGDVYSLPVLVKKFAQAKKQLMNTTLFHDVIVSMKSIEGYEAHINIEVKERWYIFPFPFARIVDRSFGEWVKEQNMDFNRVNYGIRIKHYNTTGRNDKMTIYLMGGYTRQVALEYKGLLLDKKQQWSSNLGFAYGKNKQLDYITTDNKRQFFKSDETFVHSFLDSYLEFSYRRAIKTKHTFGAGYHTLSIPDTVLEINPKFLLNNKSSIKYPEFYYIMSHFNVDYIPYPTKGYTAEDEKDTEKELTATSFAYIQPYRSNSLCFVFDAMQNNIPALIDASSPLIEIEPEAVLCFDTHSAEDIADALMRIYRDEALYSELVEKGKELIGKDYWKETVSRIRESLEVKEE